MDNIVKILVTRDGITENEAENILEECRSEVYAAIDEGESVEDVEYIIQDYLGLEPDYLFDIL